MGRWWQVLVALSALVALGMVLVWVLGPGRGSAEALTLAQQSARALETVAVKGTVRTLASTPRGPVEARAEMHRGAGRVHIHYLSGPAAGMEVHRDGDSIWSSGPEGIDIRRAQIGERGWSHELMRRNWHFQLRGERTVAGRPGRLLTARGPGGRLTVVADRETSFPLVLKRSSPDGRTLSETVWETADFSVGPPPPTEPPANAQVIEHGRRRVSPDEARAAAGFALLAPTRVPSGFTLEGWFVHERRYGTLVETRYTDGLRPLLIIQQSASAAAEAAARRERESGGDREGREGAERRGRGGPQGREGRVGSDGQEGPDGREQGPRERLRPGEAPLNGPRMPDGPRVGVRRRDADREPTMRMRGAGGRALRREIDGVLVIVIGPGLGEALTDVLDSMAPLSDRQGEA